MNKILCIYPKDQTTEFLQPIYDILVEKFHAVGLMGDPTDDDEYLEKLENRVKESDLIVFLGHGTSRQLYGFNFNPIVCEENANINWFKDKDLLLFSCYSADFLMRYNLTPSIGFDVIPTSLIDVENRKFHNCDLSFLKQADLFNIRNKIVNIWKRTLFDIIDFNLDTFQINFNFNVNIEIVDVLVNREEDKNYTTIADILYYIKDDMMYLQDK